MCTPVLTCGQCMLGQACTHARVRAHTHTHTHTKASNRSSAENRWALPGLGKAPDFQLHPRGVLRLRGWQRATPAGFSANGRLLLLTPSGFPGLSHQPAFPRTLPAPASTTSPCPSLQDPSPPLKAQLQLFTVEHSLPWYLAPRTTKAHPHAGAGRRQQGPPAPHVHFTTPGDRRKSLRASFLRPASL